MATTLRASTIYIRKYAANTDCRQRKKYRNGEKTVTWYDRNGSHYVSLAYNHMTSDGGYPRYYTILCYGI